MYENKNPYCGQTIIGHHEEYYFTLISTGYDWGYSPKKAGVYYCFDYNFEYNGFITEA